MVAQSAPSDDIFEPGTLHVVVVRSMVAHGTLNGVDVAEAEAMPGVRVVYHVGNGLDLAPMQMFAMMPPTLNRPVFCTDRVRFVGDIVAAVVAETRQQAVDAAQTSAVVRPMPDEPPVIATTRPERSTIRL